MQNPRLASRYAKSLVDLAVEQNQLESVQQDMLVLQQLFKGNRDVVTLLKSPIIKADKKQKILAAVLEGKVSPLTTSFINLLITKGRESYLPEMLFAYLQEYDVIKKINKVKITSAVPLDDATLAQIKKQVEAGSDASIELETAVNEALIGGFVLETGDKLVDASVLRDLKDIKKQFEKNIYVPNIR